MELTLPRPLAEFVTREDGPTAVEYAVMLALIVVVCIGAITALGSNTNSTFGSVSDSIQPASDSTGDPSGGAPAGPDTTSQVPT